MAEHVIVVGGSRGLGKSFADRLKSQGHTVSIIARTTPAGQREGYYCCDVSQTDQIVEALGSIHRERGAIHGLACFQRFRGDGDDWDGELRVTLTATKVLIEQCVPLFANEGPRSIVLVSSVITQFISEGASCGYHVAKAGLCQLARFFACRLGEKGIRVNAVCPGPFVKPETEAYYRANPAVVERIAKTSPLNRMATYEDIADAVSFLLGEKSSFITGQSLVIDGGASLRWPGET